MPKKRSKRYKAAAEMVDSMAVYSIEDAVSLVKKFPAPKFDQTVTLTFRMGVDPRQSDQMVRGTCPLPHGSGKDVRVLVFAEGEAAAAAKEAGAEFVGYEALIKEVLGGFMDFDAVIATPSAMAEVRKLGRQLGPRGLMPNPKTGTVTFEVGKAVKDIKGGKVEYRVDKFAIMHLIIGKVSFDERQLIENYEALLDEIIRAKPSAAKGKYLRTITLSTTMGPGIKVDTAKTSHLAGFLLPTGFYKKDIH